jgi:hypothetical protein
MTSEESEVTESVSEPGVTNPRRHRRRNSRNYVVKKLYDWFKPFVSRNNNYQNTHCQNIYVCKTLVLFAQYSLQYILRRHLVSAKFGFIKYKLVAKHIIERFV